MATTNTAKRKFYNTGDAKGFTKEVFFQTVSQMAQGDELDDTLVDLVIRACEYELEGIASRKTNSAGEKRDPLQSDYAKALREALVPLLTNEPMTAKEILDAAEKRNIVSPKGTPFAAPWVSRVFNSLDNVTVVKKVINKVSAKGLKMQSEATAYRLRTPEDDAPKA